MILSYYYLSSSSSLTIIYVFFYDSLHMRTIKITASTNLWFFDDAGACVRGHDGATQNFLRNFQFPAYIKCFISLCYFLSTYFNRVSWIIFPPIKQARARLALKVNLIHRNNEKLPRRNWVWIYFGLRSMWCASVARWSSINDSPDN